MVKELIKYKCEICGIVYDNLEEATNCESKGIMPLHPIGTVYGMYKEPDMVFAVIVQIPNNHPHSHGYLTWACRDTPIGDNCTGEEFCGFNSWDKIYPPNKKAPAYIRMIEALQKANIKPIDYKNEGSVS